MQPQPPTVAASATYGCSLGYIGVQPLLPTVAASAAYGCRAGTSEKWKHSSAVMIRCRKAFCLGVGTI